MMEKETYRRFRGHRAGLMLLFWVASCSTSPVESPTSSSDAEAAVPSNTLKAETHSTASGVIGSEEIRAELSAPEVADGAALWLTLRLPKSRSRASVIGHFEGIELPFFRDSHCGEDCVSTVMGVPHGHKVGLAEIFIEVEGESKPLRIPFQVIDGQYASERLKVNPKHVNPPARYQARIQSDSQAVGRAYARMTQEKIWEGPFVLPIQSPITSPYGTKRMYNGELRNYHGGLDLKANVGTRVHAAAGGIVAMVRDLFYTGNTVIIDHGYGVMTVYAHLSRVRVHEGQRLTRGQLIGLSGKSGRVTGPHLHWQTVIHHVKVNPARVLQVMR